MAELNFPKMRVGFQGEPGAFSEAAAARLLGEAIRTVPRPTFDATFQAIAEGAADALLLPVENTLAGSVLRVYDLLLESPLEMCGETILPIEHQLMGMPGAKREELVAVASHPMALAQCERFFLENPHVKRVPAEDTAGSVREMIERGDKRFGAIAGRRAAGHYGAVILQENIQDNAENFTRFVLLLHFPQGVLQMLRLTRFQVQEELILPRPSVNWAALDLQQIDPMFCKGLERRQQRARLVRQPHGQ